MNKPEVELGLSYADRGPKGWLLAHNSVRPAAVDTRHGTGGFRRFWVPPPGLGLHLCDCGWRPDLGLHYSRLKPAEEEDRKGEVP